MPAVSTTIRHLAILSDSYALLGRFYQTLFGMTPSDDDRTESAVGLTDGYVGFSIGPRRSRQVGFDHFGFDVSDLDEVLARARAFPGAGHVKRSGNKVFAGLSMNDPAGNVFDLSLASAGGEGGAQSGVTEKRPRRIGHFVLRAMDPASLGRFYRDVFDLAVEPAAAGDPAVHLSDGRVGMVIAPWRIADLTSGSIDRPSLEHLGLAVESVEAFRKDHDRVVARNPMFAPRFGRRADANGSGPSPCRPDGYLFADPDGVLLDVDAG